MPRPKGPAVGILASIPNDLSEDGTPVTVTQRTTFTKERGQSPMNKNQAEDINLDDQDWMVDKLGHDGWSNIDTMPGRPFAPQLRENYGPGKYRVTPIGPDGKPIHKLNDIVNVGSPVQLEQEDEEIETRREYVNPMPGSDDMPHWMRLQMYNQERQAEEARKRAEDAENKRLEWERDQRTREYERQQRQEAADERRRDREDDDRKAAQARTDKMIELGMGLLGTLATGFMAKQQQQQIIAPAKDPDQRLLDIVLAERSSRSDGHKQFRETVEMLNMVDRLREPREDYRRGKDEDEDDPMAMIAKIAPLLAMIRGGPVPTGGQGQADLQEVMRQVIRNPDAIRALAKEDPKGIAKVIYQAVKGDPELETAVVDAFQEQEKAAEEAEQTPEPVTKTRKLRAAKE